MLRSHLLPNAHDLLQPFMLPLALVHLPPPRRVLIADDHVPGVAPVTRAALPTADIVAFPEVDPGGPPFDAVIISAPAVHAGQVRAAIDAAMPLLTGGGSLFVSMDTTVFHAAAGILGGGDLAVRPYWLTGDERGFGGLMLASISPMRPAAWIFAGLSFRGKSVGAAELARRTGLPVTHGDLLLYDIGLGRLPAPEPVASICREGVDRWDISWPVTRLFAAGLADSLLDLVPGCNQGASFILDLWLSDDLLPVLPPLIARRGFKTWIVSDPLQAAHAP
ncbi:MAG: hypothetical protein ACKOWF_10100 [Chloroflexota bacterium]